MQRRSLIRSLVPFAWIAGGGVLPAGCGGGGAGENAAPGPAPAPSPPPSPPQQVRTFAYVANNASSSISVYEIALSGALEPPVNVQAEAARSISIHPAGRFAHVTHDNGTISVFRIVPETGMLEPTTHVTPVNGPGKVLYHPSGKFAYVHEFDTFSIFIYSVDAESGALTSKGQLALAAEFVRGIDIDPSGNFVYLTGSQPGSPTGAGNLYCYSVDVDTGGLVFRSSLAAGPHPGRIAAAPAGGRLFVNNSETISAHSVDQDGQLGAATFVEALNVTSMVLDPAGRFLYATTAGPVIVTVSAYAVESSGALTLRGETRTPGALERVLAISRSGKHVYMTELSGDAVHVLDIDQDSGVLTLRTPPVATGSEPVDISVADLAP